ncbi:response regulator transcription factor [Sphingomonas canadensis]|uniref:Response regulator transcription factor n=1 Tax=Sphingomonas canadensis TaxID=1219257 RepID=A0ABW3HBB1_9SPHN|nr:response regulator [Sphingomonas canadensis]MCW3837299.1 response regulator [Sphingomonas canadensis]
MDRRGTSDTQLPCVLLVDDDPAVRRAITLLLKTSGYAVHGYDRAADLLGDPRARAAQCLITDYAMPAIDGVTLLRTLRAQGWTAPAILITGLYKSAIEQMAREAGFSAMLEKPLTDERLLDLLAACLNDRARPAA